MSHQSGLPMWVSNFDLHQHAYRIYQGTFNTRSTVLWPSNSQGLRCQSQSWSLTPGLLSTDLDKDKPQYTRGCSVYILTDKAAILHINSLLLPYKLSTSVSTYNWVLQQFFTSITYRQLGTTSLQFTHTQLQTIEFTASQSEWLNTNTVTYHS